MKKVVLNRIKLALAICIAMASVSLLANAKSLDSTSPAEKATNGGVTNKAPNTQTCPNVFYQVKLPENGKLCQVFAADLPASMIFFVPQAPSEVLNYYKQDSAAFSITKQVKNRYMLQSADKNTTVIISSDGEGTQVDVLVKNEQI